VNQQPHPVRVVLFGTPLDTGNLGVSALGLATLSTLATRIPGLDVTVFDHGSGRGPLALGLDGVDIRSARQGAWISKRFYRGESLWSMLSASRVAPQANDAVRRIAAASAVLDVSGGDSFSDIYGKKQRDLAVLPKRIALNLGRPLILLPQTYGPFRAESTERTARRILSASQLAWARDRPSFDSLRALLRDDFDPLRHRLGVDVAFGLPATDPGEWLGPVQAWFREGHTVAGMNVSGLLANPSEQGSRRFGLAADYTEAMELVARRLLRGTDIRLLLVPHVRGVGGESDDEACARLAARLQEPRRVAILPPGLSAGEVKHVVSRLDWFVGARMHATIAALSSRVPVVGIAYSAKFQGVFDACGVGHRVLDARSLETNELVEASVEAWRDRADDAPRLGASLPRVERALEEQFDDIAAFLTAGSSAAPRAR
jgi:colanic acid/amylovoran biosynthesis protein